MCKELSILVVSVGLGLALSGCHGDTNIGDAADLNATGNSDAGGVGAGSPTSGDPTGTGVEPPKQGPITPCAAAPSDPSCNQATVLVNPAYNPYLSGMPFGTVSDSVSIYQNDVSTPNRVVVISNDLITDGAQLTFTVSGQTNHYNGPDLFGPDGNPNQIFERMKGNVANPQVVDFENGIATVRAPADSLVGVFLSFDPPNTTPNPDVVDADCPSDFSSVESRNRLVYRPKLKQMFFIGDGRTDDGQVQTFIAPPGARRLYFSNMDVSGWYDNIGQLNVLINSRLPSSN